MDAYYETVDWLQGANNGGALFVKGMADIAPFIKGMADICMGWPSGAALLAWAEEGDLQASYVLVVLKYYKHGITDDVFNHIRRVYGKVTSGSQVGTRWRMEDRDYDEDYARVMGVHHRVFDEIVHVRWREHIHPDHLYKIHIPEDGYQCLWKLGCGEWWAPVFYSLRCRIITELYEFLIRFPQIIDIMDDIEM
jgi:hypothetical protein